MPSLIIDMNGGLVSKHSLIENNFVFVFEGTIYNRNYIKKIYNLPPTLDDKHIIFHIMRHLIKVSPMSLLPINGCFSYILYDVMLKTCFSGTDHVGIKQIYYGVDTNNNFVISTSNDKGLTENLTAGTVNTFCFKYSNDYPIGWSTSYYEISEQFELWKSVRDRYLIEKCKNVYPIIYPYISSFTTDALVKESSEIIRMAQYPEKIFFFKFIKNYVKNFKSCEVLKLKNVIEKAISLRAGICTGPVNILYDNTSKSKCLYKYLVNAKSYENVFKHEILKDDINLSVKADRYFYNYEETAERLNSILSINTRPLIGDVLYEYVLCVFVLCETLKKGDDLFLPIFFDEMLGIDSMYLSATSPEDAHMISKSLFSNSVKILKYINQISFLYEINIHLPFSDINFLKYAMFLNKEAKNEQITDVHPYIIN